MSLKAKKARITKEAKKTDKRIESFVADFSTWFKASVGDLLDDIKDNNEPVLALGGLINGMYERGLKPELNKIAGLYGSELATVKRELARDGLEWQVVNEDTVEALIQFRVEDIENRAGETIGSLRPMVLESIITGERPDFDKLEEQIGSRLTSYAKTELDTSIAAFNRTLTFNQGQAVGIEQYLYIGPFDKITRPFCRDVLASRSPAIYSIKEIASMDNGQGLSVIQTGGGYNCRHIWSPVPKGREKELIQETTAVD